MKKIIIIIIFAISFNSYSQNRVGLNIFQDIKLATIGDHRGNRVPTMDAIFGIIVEGSQNGIGYHTYALRYEQANLYYTLKRYSIGTGYSVNKLVERLNISIMIDYGLLDRYRNGSIDNYSNWSTIGEVSYSLNSNISLSLASRLMKRSDLKVQVIRYSSFVGISIYK